MAFTLRPKVTAARSRSASVCTYAVGPVHSRTASATKRSLLGGVISGIALISLARTAEARDYKEALAQKEARKAKLRGTMDKIKTSGKDQQVFKESAYMVSEEARTPNVHSRQDEGAKTQENF